MAAAVVSMMTTFWQITCIRRRDLAVMAAMAMAMVMAPSEQVTPPIFTTRAPITGRAALCALSKPRRMPKRKKNLLYLGTKKHKPFESVNDGSSKELTFSSSSSSSGVHLFIRFLYHLFLPHLNICAIQPPFTFHHSFAMHFLNICIYFFDTHFCINK